jgi:hypothetical protein
LFLTSGSRRRIVRHVSADIVTPAANTSAIAGGLNLGLHFLSEARTPPISMGAGIGLLREQGIV